MRTLAQIVFEGKKLLQQVANSDLESRILACNVLGLSQEQYILCKEKPVSPEEEKKIQNLFSRRLKSEPIAYLIGVKEFMGLEFNVNPSTLIPRPDSELLVESIINYFEKKLKQQPKNILDVGTGSGCLLISLLKYFPQANGVGVDISKQACQTAQENAEKLGVSSRTSFSNSSWFDAFSDLSYFDVILSNPPYINPNDKDSLQEDLLFEPQSALYAPNRGLSSYDIIATTLKNKDYFGPIFLEIGHRQEEEIIEIFDKKSFTLLMSYQDLQDIPRCLLFQRFP